MPKPIQKLTMRGAAIRAAVLMSVTLLLVTCGGLATSYSAGVLPLLHTCPQCHQACQHKICVPTPTTLKDEKSCWCIETKEICIPHIRWPWQPCCEPPKCGRVRTVKVLKKVEYECEKCGYKWEIKSACCAP
jgi:hypothetical protein